jgi:hypothetical protein
MNCAGIRPAGRAGVDERSGLQIDVRAMRVRAGHIRGKGLQQEAGLPELFGLAVEFGARDAELHFKRLAQLMQRSGLIDRGAQGHQAGMFGGKGTRRREVVGVERGDALVQLDQFSHGLVVLLAEQGQVGAGKARFDQFLLALQPT